MEDGCGGILRQGLAWVARVENRFLRTPDEAVGGPRWGLRGLRIGGESAKFFILRRGDGWDNLNGLSRERAEEACCQAGFAGGEVWARKFCGARLFGWRRLMCVLRFTGYVHMRRSWDAQIHRLSDPRY